MKSFLLLVAIVGLSEAATKFTIVHTNDFHCRPFPHYDWPGGENIDCTNPAADCYGGLAALKGYFDNINNQEEIVLHLNSGDSYDPALSYCTGGNLDFVVDGYSLMEYDAVVMGNHEWDDGDTIASDFVTRSTPAYPVLCANCEFDPEGIYKDLKPYVVVEKSGVKFGLIGVTVNTTCLHTEEFPEMRFGCETEAVQRYVAELQSQDVDYIIVLSHSGQDTFDTYLAENVAGINIIVGAHSHTAMFPDAPISPPFDEQEEVYLKYPTEIQNTETSQNVLIVQAYKWGKYGASLTVTYDGNNLVEFQGDVALMDRNARQNVTIANAMQSLLERETRSHKLHTPQALRVYQDEYDGELGACSC